MTLGTKFWSFKSSAEDPSIGELSLYGPIDNETWWGDEITPKMFKDELNKLGNIAALNVYINSPGGDVFAGQAIHSMLARHPAKVNVYVDGLAASVASVIAMAGDQVVMPKNAMMMIHNPWTFAVGNSADFRKLADDLDKVRESLIAAYQSKSSLPKEDIIALMDAETWLTADEAVQYGFADQIEESKQVAACLRGGKLFMNGVEMDLSKYKNPPRIEAAKPTPVIQATPVVDAECNTVTVGTLDASAVASRSRLNIAGVTNIAGTLISVQNGVVPSDVSEKLAPEDTPWEVPTLKDFTDKSWGDLTDQEKRHIAGHFAWAAEMPPAKYGDLKFPHHRPSDGAVVWHGVANCAARLDQADIPEEDKAKVRAHLEHHYEQFGKTPPWKENNMAQERIKPLSFYAKKLRFNERKGMK
ncbi:MAG: Clp protease ClpP [Alicyclobacillus sp.]|nr:Clp protease ClpP [Alicyclobacillus sp.]